MCGTTAHTEFIVARSCINSVDGVRTKPATKPRATRNMHGFNLTVPQLYISSPEFAQAKVITWVLAEPKRNTAPCTATIHSYIVHELLSSLIPPRYQNLENSADIRRFEMQHIQSSFEALVSQHFHVVPVRTQRQDQWYKRFYQTWKDDHPTKEPIILASKAAKEDWLSELNASAILAARPIRQHAEDQPHTIQPLSKEKLFSDDILSKDIAILGPEYVAMSPLKPGMQRLSYWTENFKKNREEYQRAIKVLLASDQLDVLRFINVQSDSQIEHAAFVQTSASRTNAGWASLIDETLELLMALIILKVHTETLPLGTAHETWIPFAFARSQAASKLQCIFPLRTNEDHGNYMFQDAINWCLRVLTASSTLLSACNVADYPWEQRIINAFLYFVGFEAWNREREGEWYLPCDLNKTKDGKWLKKVTGLRATPEENTDGPTSRKKKQDPLKLRDPRKEKPVEMSEEEKELDDELASVEAEERVYGLNKSAKYRRK